jgi:hypothetical protein
MGRSAACGRIAASFDIKRTSSEPHGVELTLIDPRHACPVAFQELETL